MVTFEIDQVHPFTKLLEKVSKEELWKLRTHTVPEAASSGDFVNDPLNPFLAAVRSAWTKHYPLVLSPDAVWLTIAQGLAIHVNENAETLRHHFVAHQGQVDIHVKRGANFVKGRPDNDWPSVLGDFGREVQKHVGKRYDLIVSNFSTTGPTERVASEIVLLDTMKAYFEYHFHTLCGFPRITLTGTKADWEDIVQRTQVLSEFGLGWWTAQLVPVLQEFVKTFDRDVNQSFWHAFYSEGGGSGGPYVTGWINTFFPYLGEGQRRRKNTVLTRDTRLKASDWVNVRAHMMSGPCPDDFPSGLSVAPFTWHDHVNGVEYPMDFVGGLIGVTQREDGTLEPKAGWAIRDRKAEPTEPSGLKENEEREARREARERELLASLPTGRKGWSSAEIVGVAHIHPEVTRRLAQENFAQTTVGVDHTKVLESITRMNYEQLEARLLTSKAETEEENALRRSLPGHHAQGAVDPEGPEDAQLTFEYYGG